MTAQRGHPGLRARRLAPRVAQATDVPFVTPAAISTTADSAQHRPDDRNQERFLNGAACHGCLLIAEPSCERRNEFLDRALVAATVGPLGTESFG